MFQWPVDPEWKITSGFGERIHPVDKKKSFHSGVDIGCPVGTHVYAPFDGVVTSKWIDALYGGGLSLTLGCRAPDGKGRIVMIRFGFAHLLNYANGKKVGYAVKRGDLLALTGGRPGDPGAGKSSGPHLHMTVRSSGAKIDPLSLPWTINFPGRERRNA